MTAPSMVAADDPAVTELFALASIPVENWTPRPSIVRFEALTEASSASVLPLLTLIPAQKLSLPSG